MPETSFTKNQRLKILEQDVAQLRKDGAGDRVVCYCNNKMYSPGAHTCQEKLRMICSDEGKWVVSEDPSDRDS